MIRKEKTRNPYLRAALAREAKTNFRIADPRAEYEADWTARPYRSSLTPDNLLCLWSQRNFGLVDEPPLIFNWVARRDPVWLVSGDLPRFALATIHPTANANPPILCLSEVRLRLTVGGESFWLDEGGRVRARYRPWGTRHVVSLDTPAGLTAIVEASLAEDRGIAVRADIRADGGRSLPVTLEFVVGVMHYDEFCTVLSRYLRSSPEEDDWHLPQRVKSAERFACNGDSASISNPDVPYRVYVVGDARVATGVYPYGKTSRECLVYRYEMTATAEPQAHRLLVGKLDGHGPAPLRMEQAEAYEAETRGYYADMLEAVRLETPDELLDAAFHSAVVNLDYQFHDFAWLEGLKAWNCYWANNYQIRAAVLLGQVERAREALIGLATREGGPGNPRSADGSPFGGETSQDALPYYIVSLWRYWRSTEDRETLRRVWPAVTKALGHFLRFYDPDQDGLLHWHKGVNSFMYQGDHHRLPGAALSPSVMTAFNLDCLAEMAEALGGEVAAPAVEWRRRAVYIRGEVMRRLWLPAEGRFAGCVDLQGRMQQVVYYTDFAFPVLFADYPDPIKWLAIEAMDRILALGDDLLRTGTLQPDMFGNNVPHVTSNCEGAEACFAMGRAERGVALLRAVAKACTVFTNSPGAVPEYLGLRGEGLPNYVFGPPAGSYLLGVLRGLWGIERQAGNGPFDWRPALPAGWDHARVVLPGIEAAFEGRAQDRTHMLRFPEARAARVRLPLFGRRLDQCTDAGGAPLNQRIVPHPGGGFVLVELPAAAEHRVRLVLGETLALDPFPRLLQAGSQCEATLPLENMRLHDPQGVFTEFRIEGKTFIGSVADTEGGRTVFLAAPGIMCPLGLEVRKPTPERREKRGGGPLVLAGRRTPVPLDSWVNDNTIPGDAYPPWGEPRFVEGPIRGTPVVVAVGPYRFEVRDETPRLVRLALGQLTGENTLQFDLASRESLRIPVGGRVQGVEFLLVSGVDCCLTGMEVAECVWGYADGFEERRPLLYGRELEHPAYPFATDAVDMALPPTRMRQMSWPWRVHAFALPVRAERELDYLELRVTALTTTLGVFAVNLVKAI